ncbi:MAG: Nucleoside-triphosphatase THEP1 [Holosporales bacterium]
MKIFLTGTPGVGKSTVLTKVRDLLKGRSLLGCVVRQCCENGSRTGFDLVKIPSEDTFPLARKNNSLGPIFHSKYSVNVPLLTQDLIPYMDFMKNAQNIDVLLFDEIGHMQNKCPTFLKALDDLLKTQTPLIATILADDEAWARPYKNRSDTFYLSVTPENRDIIPSLVDDLLRQNLCAKNLPPQVFSQYIHNYHKLFYQNRFLEIAISKLK